MVGLAGCGCWLIVLVTSFFVLYWFLFVFWFTLLGVVVLVAGVGCRVVAVWLRLVGGFSWFWWFVDGRLLGAFIFCGLIVRFGVVVVVTDCFCCVVLGLLLEDLGFRWAILLPD